ncbi:hypothetical protein JI435_110420 [Parastagonospora nodorum SN15]|uniref:Uncharacterized protein n=1 Tax=Phaeosphaeria nodorum (strain SN15 / ATCC MYA-4574 / FGSC 10173) TaxID=321614 RepID=A0A7U2FKR1_PHANO|nr:hypothetical protein JI435_110420 [Parastagonospora nodorum SN15]
MTLPLVVTHCLIPTPDGLRQSCSHMRFQRNHRNRVKVRANSEQQRLRLRQPAQRLAL